MNVDQREKNRMANRDKLGASYRKCLQDLLGFTATLPVNSRYNAGDSFSGVLGRKCLILNVPSQFLAASNSFTISTSDRSSESSLQGAQLEAFLFWRQARADASSVAHCGSIHGFPFPVFHRHFSPIRPILSYLTDAREAASNPTPASGPSTGTIA